MSLRFRRAGTPLLSLLAAAALAMGTLALGGCMGPAAAAPTRSSVLPIAPRAGTSEPGRISAANVYDVQFETLGDRFAELYPSFPYKRVDWNAQRAAYRSRASRARSQDEFIAIVREMLEPLRDLHVWFVDPRGEVVPTYRPRRTANFDQARWERALRDANYITRGEIGEGTIGGYAYLYLRSWKAPVGAQDLDLLMSRMRESPGLIIDVRVNAGGNDATALALVSRFTTRPLVASYVQMRNGPNQWDLDVQSARTVSARGLWQYTRPVVVLAGPGGFSATESFVAAMRTLPNVTVIGDTTGGASGNPATFPLANGWQFTVPRWMEFGPDRQPIEGRGVPPHIVIPWAPGEYDSDRDPLIDAAVGLLGELNGVYRIAPAPSATSGKDGAKDSPKDSAVAGTRSNGHR
ncbi:MAG: S41 family peptidase [Gemmatimonas sp.]